MLPHNKKVAFIRADYDCYGGAERFTNFLMSALVKQGFECHIFAKSWTGQASDIQFHKVPGFSIPSVLRHMSFVFFVKRELSRETFDLIQSNERTLSQTIYRAGDGVHAQWVDLRKKMSNPWRRLLLTISPFHCYMRWLERKMFQSPILQAIIVNSEMVRKEIVDRFCVADEKIHTIYNGVDLEVYNPKHRTTVGHDLRRDLGVGQGEVVALFVGSGYQRKGVSQILEAMAKIEQPSCLWIVGKDSLPRYQKMADRLGIAKRVKFFGKQTNVQPFYAAADFFVLPTLYDPFPSVALEAIASGLPVIVTKQCGAAEIISHGQEGFVLESQADNAIVGYMQHLFANQTRRSAMSEKAVLLARKFSGQKTIASFIDLYNCLLGCAI